MGSRIEVDSQVCVGATFRFEISLAKAVSADVQPIALTQCHALIIGDVNEQRQILTRY